MENFLKSLSQKKFEVHLLAFLLIMLPSIPLYFAAQANATVWIWFLLGLIITGNLLASLTR